MSLSERLVEYVRACFTGLWIQSHEHDDALTEIAQLCQTEGWRLAVWDIDQGLSISQQTPATSATDPLAALHALPTLAVPDGTALLVLVNFHRFLGSADVVQALARQIALGKQHRTFVLILAPVVQIPAELEKQFVVLEHALPDRGQLEEIARSLTMEADDLPQGPELHGLLDAASGLTRQEAEGAFSLSLVRHGRLLPEALWELKSQALKQSGLIKLHQGNESFRHLGGLEPLKGFCRQALTNSHSRASTARPRGILLLGVPGTGKSAFAKALGQETSRPTLTLDMGALFGSLVGQTEQNIRQSLRIAEAMAPCILFVDEVEKGLGGVAGNSASDSGVSSRLFGTLLTWLSDHDSDVFVVCTANDVSRLPPEFARAERFDAIYFLDLPGKPQRQAIWELCLDQFELASDQPRPTDQGWTGAEIRSCCRLAALLGVSLVDAAEHVVPVSVTAAEGVDRLRAWADGRCLSADRHGIYRRQPAGAARVARKVNRDPSQN